MNPDEGYAFQNSVDSNIAALESLIPALEAHMREVKKRDDPESMLRTFDLIRFTRNRWFRNEIVTPQYKGICENLFNEFAALGAFEYCDRLLQRIKEDKDTRGQPLLDMRMYRAKRRVLFVEYYNEKITNALGRD